MTAHPKPASVRRPAVKVYTSGREVCSKTKVGRDEYYKRTCEMVARQMLRCAICSKYISYCGSQFDHEAGRGHGGGHRDDRIEVEGNWQNAALCITCNSEKGSKRYHWVDSKYVPVERER